MALRWWRRRRKPVTIAGPLEPRPPYKIQAWEPCTRKHLEAMQAPNIPTRAPE